MNGKDRKILSVLDRNSRASFSEIAKATGIGQETIRYRMQQLSKNIITHTPTLINAPKLGYTYYDVMFKLQNVDERKRNAFISYLVRHPRVGWVAELEGNYDVAIITPVKNQIALQQLIDELYKQFSNNIMRKSVSVLLIGNFYPRDYLTGKQRIVGKKHIQYVYEEQIAITEKEEQLCRELAVDSRLSAVELAERLHVSPDTVLNMIKKLVKHNIILGHYMTFKQEEIGQSHYKILLYLNNVTEEKLQQFLSYAQINNRVIAIIRVFSDHDYEIDLEVEDVHQLRAYLMDLNNKFASIIRDYSTLRITAMPKYTFFP